MDVRYGILSSARSEEVVWDWGGGCEWGVAIDGSR